MSKPKPQVPAGYEWPRIDAVHPDHGAYRVDVHCARSPESGDMVLVAFFGVPGPEQVETVLAIAAQAGDDIVPITNSDITPDIALSLASAFAAHPSNKVAVLQVQR